MSNNCSAEKLEYQEKKIHDYTEKYLYKFDGKRYDCGSKLGYLQANVEYGLKRSDLGEEFTQFIKNLQI